MELDRLEVVFDGDLSPIEEKVARFEQKMDSMMSRVKSSSGQGMDAVEKNLSDSKGFDKFTKQFEKMNSNFDSMLKRMNQSASSNGEEVGKSLSAGVSKGAVKMTKDVQTAVDKVNTQMQQAKAAQQRISNLQANKNGARLSGDTKSESRIGEQISKAQIQMNKSQQQAQAIVRGLRSEYDAIPNSLSSISAKMEGNERQIEAMRAKVKALKNEMKMQQIETGNFASGKWKSTGIQDTPQSTKTAESISKQSAKMEKLIADNDALQRSYAQLEDRSGVLKTALSSVNTELGEQPVKARMAANGMRNLSGSTKQSEGLFSRFKNMMSNSIGRFGGLFDRQSKQVTNGTSRMAQGMGGFGRSMKMLWSQLFLFTFLYQGIMTLAGGLFKALQTNAQFSASLNQIKVNLLTAFYPIYQAALPAINALMSALAKVTGYIAGFISTLFGMNIGDAFNGAQGLMNNVQALDDTGNAASDASDGYDEMAQSIRDSNKQLKAQHDQTEAARKKVKEYKRLLAGFDELNILDFSNDSDEDFSDPFVPQEIPSKPKNPNAGGSKAPWADFGSATVPETPKWLTDFAKKFKDIMSQLFDPIKKAWDAQGQKVIDAWKYALREVVGLIQAIGESFMEVWTNGTGQRFVENLLILLADVLSIIGDIAGAFKRAWEDNGRGTALIQSIFDMFNSILELLHQIAVSFRNAWNDGVGERIAANILEIFTNINNTISNLADRLSIAWQTGNIGESIFRRILGIIEGLLVNINNITKATAEWAKKLDFTPLLRSIDGLLKSIQPLTKNIGDGLEWFYKNVLLPLAGFTIEKLIPAFFEALAGAIDLVNGIINGCKPAFDFLWNNILKPLAEWTGGVIVDVLKKIGDVLSGIGNWISEHSEGFSTFVTIVASFATALGLVNGAIAIWNGVAVIATGVTTALSGAIAFLTSPIGLAVLAIGAIIAVGVTLWQNWDTIKEKAGELGTWLSEKWEGIKTATSEAWNNVKNWTSEKWSAAKDAVTSKASEIYNVAKDKFTNTANTVRDKAGQAKDWAEEKFKNLADGARNKFDDVRSSAQSKWSDISEKVRSGAETARSKAETAFSSMKDNLGKSLHGVKDTASEVFGKIGGWAKDLPGNIAKGLSDGLQSIKQAMNNIANGLASGIGKGVNGIISGVNWVMSSLGAGWRLSSWQVPYFSYATGTNSHPGGLAMVNDGSGSNWREMYKLPNGQMGMFPNQKDYMVNLPKGTQVLNGRDTSNFMSNIPHYKGGLIDSVKNFFGSISPSALLDRAFEKFVDVADIPEPGASMALGAAKRIKSSAFRVVSDRISELFRLDRENESKKKGFANGGRVDQFGWYKMSEGNNTEWVVPVTKPELAFQRINEALDFMGYDGIPDLTMPEVFRDSSDSYTGSSSSGKKNKGFSITGNGMENLSDNLLSSLGNTIANAIINALSNLDLKGNDGPLEVVLEVDSTRLGQVTVRGINQYHEQIGNVELNL
ncbi:hypothetical protein P7D52_13145 [Enterococcus dongliensis]|uniref:Phage tail protein n=1 Tax=Enterococcus dongliensis TaxID=2559925 RepID=A0AAW8TF96_9ENTE|nr:hypothetical protein [Enterococcus dongliensis]MDT2635070.1 hypothetical protein [Enterococcus dongliensis]MDT2636247.1 hypothetical protein [Enterococcus dongliensis]MDT2643725.1 hypothetical protein [Enterococcus dongliensis]